MSRPDLDFLRAQILDTFYLTRDEVAKLKYWNEEKLLDTLALFEAITESEREFYEEIEETERPDADRYDFPDDYSREDFYDEDFWYEYEAIIDYGND